jgi:hypothetical protein
MSIEYSDFFAALDGALKAARDHENEVECGFSTPDERLAEIHCTLTKANVIEVVNALIVQATGKGRADGTMDIIHLLEIRRQKLLNEEV